MQVEHSAAAVSDVRPDVQLPGQPLSTEPGVSQTQLTDTMAGAPAVSLWTAVKRRKANLPSAAEILQFVCQ